MLKVGALSDVACRVNLSHYTVLVSRILMPHADHGALLTRPVIDSRRLYVSHMSLLLDLFPILLE